MSASDTYRTNAKHHFDLVVVGAGSGGYAAARTARDLGATVALVDRGPLGGLCILRGCMPSKTLIATGDAAARDARGARARACIAGEPTIDFAAVMAAQARDHQGVRRLPHRGDRDVSALPRRRRRFESPHELRVGDDVLDARRRSSSRPAARSRRRCFRGWPRRATSTATRRSTSRRRRSRSSCWAAATSAANSVSSRPHRRPDDDPHPQRRICSRRRRRRRRGADASISARKGSRVETPGRGAARRGRARRPEGRALHCRTASRKRSARTRSSTRWAASRTSTGSISKPPACAYHAVTGIEVDETLRTSQPHIFAVGDVTGRLHARARRDPAGRDRGAQRGPRRRTSAPTTASRRRTRSSPIRRSRSSARPRRSCTRAGDAVPDRHAIRSTITARRSRSARPRAS